ncbi:MAG TPA: hypothetical protein VMT74_03285 [Gaiellaceae bacterium]|nr:hypothetical protein [Gaiellaceae bacterium]
MSATDDYRKRVFVGVSKAEGDKVPSLHEAAADAHAQMEAAGVTGRLRLLESYHNPISEYHVVFVTE